MKSFVALLLVSSWMMACGDGGSSADAAPDGTPGPDGTPLPDARPADLSCVGVEPPPVDVPDPLTIAGVTKSIGAGGSTPVGSVAVAGRNFADDAVVDSGTSGADGAY